MENPIKMDDLGVPLFLETPVSGKIQQQKTMVYTVPKLLAIENYQRSFGLIRRRHNKHPQFFHRQEEPTEEEVILCDGAVRTKIIKRFGVGWDPNMGHVGFDEVFARPIRKPWGTVWG